LSYERRSAQDNFAAARKKKEFMPARLRSVAEDAGSQVHHRLHVHHRSQETRR